jgi:hypothetical protein
MVSAASEANQPAMEILVCLMDEQVRSGSMSDHDECTQPGGKRLRTCALHCVTNLQIVLRAADASCSGAFWCSGHTTSSCNMAASFQLCHDIASTFLCSCIVLAAPDSLLSDFLFMQCMPRTGAPARGCGQGPQQCSRRCNASLPHAAVGAAAGRI